MIVVRASVLILVVMLLAGCALFEPRVERYIQYPVQSGDTINKIGIRFNVSNDELIEINEIDDPRALRIGQIVKVPYRGQSLKRKEGETGPDMRGMMRPSESSLKKVKLLAAKKYIGKLSWPVQGGGALRSHFGTRGGSFHEGIDIAAKTGTPIYASHDGQIVYSNDGLRGYGNLIVVRGDELLSIYAHNDTNRVNRGQYVKKGQWIGDVGASGKASGPHLHFETRVRDSKGRYVAVDPFVFFP